MALLLARLLYNVQTPYCFPMVPPQLRWAHVLLFFCNTTLHDSHPLRPQSYVSYLFQVTTNLSPSCLLPSTAPCQGITSGPEFAIILAREGLTTKEPLQTRGGQQDYSSVTRVLKEKPGPDRRATTHVKNQYHFSKYSKKGRSLPNVRHETCIPIPKAN